MKITIESTTKIVQINGVPARIWAGNSESGVPVYCFITRVAIESNVKAHVEEFEQELKQQSEPSAEVQSFPIRMII